MLDIHVVSHTHWDREWYLTREQFRLRLVALVDRLLDLLDNEPAYKYFHLDGQTIVLEDYLEIRPEQHARLRRAIASGRILIGPWYVMPDEFLVSGESIVRNLARGHRIAREFASPMPVGYLPDVFGHVAQMPYSHHSKRSPASCAAAKSTPTFCRECCRPACISSSRTHTCKRCWSRTPSRCRYLRRFSASGIPTASCATRGKR